MKRIFGFFSILLLSVIIFANPPPLKFELVDDQQEVYVTFDQVIIAEAIEITDLALPLVFGAISLPAVTVEVNTGTLGVNYDGHTSYYAIQDVTVWNLNSIVEAQLYRSYENRLHLAKYLHGVTELSRLDIGEYINLS